MNKEFERWTELISKALQTALKLSKTDFATPEQLAKEENPFYSWHGRQSRWSKYHSSYE